MWLSINNGRGGSELGDKKGRETWKLWDAIFSSGLLSFFKDSQEASSNEKNFKQTIGQIVFAVIVAGVVFMIAFWIV